MDIRMKNATIQLAQRQELQLVDAAVDARPQQRAQPGGGRFGGHGGIFPGWVVSFDIITALRLARNGAMRR